MNRETVILLDFGAQYSQLIARRVREQNVFCEILPYSASFETIMQKNPVGIILTGGPASVLDEDAPKCDSRVFMSGIPVLGICYGAQLMSHMLNGNVKRADVREYGSTEIHYSNSKLFEGMGETAVCWMSHTYYVDKPPKGFDIIATTDNCPCAAFENKDMSLYGVQFHPEVAHTKNGTLVIKNFLYEICKVSGDWNMKNFITRSVEEIRNTVGDKKVLLGLSGGVDSSVVAALLNKAIGKNLICIFVDHGLLRKDEGDEVERVFGKGLDINLIRVNAQERFLKKLAGVTEPEQKRKIIGEEFIRVFEEEAKKLGRVEFLAQGTIYPDIVESGTGHAAVIKSHHNVGGLPEDVDFEQIIEPLRDLFKDEVRSVGDELNLPHHIVYRQPFPGPGLAIRIIGEITEEKLSILKEADFIFRDEVAKHGLDDEIWQYFAVLTGMRSVGVMGDERTYDYTIALRAVTSVDGMTADWAKIPYDVLGAISNRIINEASHINRIVYDITSKPPATIEWE